MKSFISIITGLFISLFVLVSCSNSNGKADAYGNFEATEIVVSAEGNGKLMAFDVNEGDLLIQNTVVGFIDTIPLGLKRELLLATKEITASKSKGVLSQIKVLNAQKNILNTNKTRIENLLKDNAATQKQLDDVQGELGVIQQQIRNIEIQNAPVIKELKSLDIQIRQLDDQIQKSIIRNPINGTVLTTFTEPQEVTAYGKPLYKIADLSTMQLRVYVSETQLAEIKIGQQVTVKVDEGSGMSSHPGIVTWIASEAEFTPKIIQTKEERVALVYAVKVDVPNEKGSLKIGMPAEMWFNVNE
ncbi:HlyD family efflux transporter periplasmic adaptor subunit [uncultured Planktosalinus sp.]|uniref:HlyD family secretion protein n=1 Tax=uncultured Planktosalinus sp. TaxID=1810935 RepID=UPI0030D9EC09